MSPTLLEFVVAALLLWVAWELGVVLIPRLRAFFSRPPADLPEKQKTLQVPEKTHRHGR